MLKQNEALYNPVKWLLKDHKKTVGAWLQLGSPMSAEILAKAQPDWLLVDLEHGPGDIMTLIAQLQAMAAYGVVPLARAPWNDFVAIKRILDAGVMGILVPYVSTREEAERAVAACKYPPEGIRGVAGSPRAAGYGMDGTRYLAAANEQILTMVQIETQRGLEEVDEIAAVEALDGIFIGPMDLSCALNHFADPKHPEVQSQIRRVEQAALAHGKFLGTVAGSMEEAQALYNRGYSLVVPMSDSTELGRAAKQTFDAFRTLYPER